VHTVAYVVTRFLKQQPANISSGRCRVIAMGESCGNAWGLRTTFPHFV